MERLPNGLPVVNHLLQHTLRSICAESQWVYAVFWRILPRNYPPPKWDSENGFLDRSKGNKRNWILTWEDGFCDFAACVKNASGAGDYLQPELFFKMSHEVYSYGEGLMGKVASDSSHKWIFKEPSEQDTSFLSPWHGALDPQPRTWDSQFKAGVQTIAIVAVQEGLLQLGSLEKIFEDLNLVIMLQRKFTYLQNIPGVFAPHPNTHRPRPLLAHTRPCLTMLDESTLVNLNELQQRMGLSSGGSSAEFQEAAWTDAQHQLLAGSKRMSPDSGDDGESMGRKVPERPPLSKSINTGHSPPGAVQPSMTSLHALLSKLPSVSRPVEATTPESKTLSGQEVMLDFPAMGHGSTATNLVCKTTDATTWSTCSTRMSTVPDANNRFSLDIFEEYGAQGDLETYNSFLSEITN